MSTASAAEPALSAFLGSLFLRLSSLDVPGLVTEKEELQRWAAKLRRFWALLIDAEQRRERDNVVNIWLNRLQDLAYDIDDILDMFHTESLELKVRKEAKFVSTCFTNFSSPVSKFKLNIEMKDKIRMARDELAHLATLAGEQHLNLLTNHRLNQKSSTRRCEPSMVAVVDGTCVSSRESDKNAIVKMLLKHDVVEKVDVDVISIVGTAGIGKTTVARHVYSDKRVQSHFDHRAWVCVSTEFDVTRITTSLLESFSEDHYERDAADLGMLQVKLRERLSRKRFLVVIDAVWDHSYADWEILRSPLKSGAPGSKILVTTRSPRVCDIMSTTPAYQLQELSAEESFSVFKDVVGVRDFNGDQDLEKMGCEIAKRVKGLPLAAKAIGVVLRQRSPCEWHRILSSGFSTSSEVRSSLIEPFRLSYAHLPSLSKRCFAYCSIFPKDYEFREEEMILLWMAEGFLSEEEPTMEDSGARCFQELVASSFFQRSGMDNSRFVMHEAVYTLASQITERICFRMDGDGGKGISEETRHPNGISEETRHLSYFAASTGEFKHFKTPKRLRTFISFASPPPENAQWMSNHVLNNLLPKMKFLRVLSLRGFSETKLPDSIGYLRLLRCLDLSLAKIRRLPDPLCALYNLQTLLLRQCRNLEKLPSEMGKLINLRNLDISETISLRGMPRQIGELTKLQTLPCFVLARGAGYRIRALKNLRHLKGELSISGLENIVATEDASEAMLGDKSGLQKLKLEWIEHSGHDNLSRGVVTEVLDKLQPPKMLQDLTVEGYDGVSFPNWVGDPSFSSLKSLELKNCKKCSSMPPLGNLTSLRYLCIKGMHSLRSVGVEFFAQNFSNVSSSLETLLFEDMPGWEDWNFDEPSVNFPCLRELSVISCSKLLGTLPSRLPSLKKLVIRRCYQLVVSISSLSKLDQLEIDGCKNLVLKSPVELSSLKNVSLSNISEINCLTEGSISGWTSVQSLKIDGCEKLISLWQNKWKFLAHMRSLKHLMISNCPELAPLGAEYNEEEKQQLEISSGINHLDLSSASCKLRKVSSIFTWLEKLQIEKCPKVVSFSEGSFPVTLKELVIKYCENLKYLLDKGKDMNFRCICHLEYMEIESCPSLISLSSRCELPSRLQTVQIAHCPKLESLSSSRKLPEGVKRLHINDCRELKSIGGKLPGQLQSLHIWNCPELGELHQSGNLPKGLRRLQIMNCEGLSSIAQTAHDGAALEYIGVVGCKNIQSLPQGLEKLGHLGETELVFCPRLTFSPESRLPKSLKRLRIDECKELKTLPKDFHNLNSLMELEISNCCFPADGFPIKLKTLSISIPKTDKTLEHWKLDGLTSIELLTIEGGDTNVVSFPPKKLLPASIVQLTVKHFQSLKSLSSNGFKKLTSLKYLTIMDCPKVVSLPKKDALPSLYRLHVDGCPLLKTHCLTRGQYNIARIPYVRLDDKLLSKEN